MSLQTKDKEYAQQFKLWEQVRAAIKGKYAVIDIVSCLPSPQYKTYQAYDGMSTDQYNQANACNKANSLRIDSYWARGRFFNATARTTESLSGMIWSKAPEVELAPRIQYLNDSANGTGTDLRDTVQAVTDDVIAVGRYGLLVDMPSNGGALTLEQMQNIKLAPRFIEYKAEQIVYSRVDENGLAEVRLSECKLVQKKEFEWEEKAQVRRLVMLDGVYTNELYNDKDELLTSTTPMANGSTMNEIPFQFFGSDNNDPSYSKVPMYDLANANLGHFVLDCDNRDNLHFHGQGMTNVFTSMYSEEFNMANPNGLDSGAKGVNRFNQGDKVEVLQIAATGAIPSEMERDENRMIALGAQLVQDTNTNVTLGAKEMEFGASTSTLKRIADNISSGMVNCLNWAGQFLGETGENTYQLNKEFITDELTPQMLQQHIVMVQGGVLPESTLNESARKAGLTDKTDEELANALSNQNLLGEGTSEEQATLQAENDALKEELAELRAAN